MAVELEIRDGDPWWLSPDVWTVPGDPLGPPGLPVVGQATYLWARVRNNGSTGVTNATVRFYWANPSVGFDRNTAHLVGTSFVSLAPAASADVLCLAPWVPEWVNGGHECVLAEAYHDSQDPLPATPAFDVPTDRHVAQRNLSVVMALQSGVFRLQLVLYNTQRTERTFRLEAVQGRLEELRPLAPRLGKRFEPPSRAGKLVRYTFADDPCAGADAFGDEGGKGEKGGRGAKGGQRIELAIPGKGSAAKTLVGEIEDGAALIHVRQMAGDRVVGGSSALVLAPSEGKGSRADVKGSRKEARS
jgi:hypothetical protein